MSNQMFVRHASILRKNLYEWDQMFHSSIGEDWPSMLGRLNAAMNQTNNLDQSIEDVMNHFVLEPRQSPMNPQDIPMFLSVRLVDDGTTSQDKDDEAATTTTTAKEESNTESGSENAAAVLTEYEKRAANLANGFEENIVRY